MNWQLKVVFLCIIPLAIVACRNDQKVIKLAEVTFNKEAELTLYKSTTDSIIAKIDIEIADTAYDVETGLMYRSSMQTNQGMLFVFPTMRPRSFYMKNTEIPLDIIYLNTDKFIVSFQENAKPLDETSLPSQVPAQYVLEINAGLAEKWLLEIGDRIDFIEIKK